MRSKYPDLSATAVVHRITATAHNGARDPSNVVGAGSVDPVAALTWQLPAGDQPGPAAKPIAVPPAPAPPDTTPRTVAVAGTAALVVLVAVAGAVIALAARRRKDPSA